LDFYQEALEHLGAVCDRSWFDRLQLVAEGAAARLWNENGGLYETELHFPEPDTSGPRDAAREVFPGCPLTFRLSETLLRGDLQLERAIIAGRTEPPRLEVAEKLWKAERPGDVRWHLEKEFISTHHFSLLALVRCEIQAIDQHWSLHRMAISLPDGERDDALAAELDLLEVTDTFEPVNWPPCNPAHLGELLSRALARVLAGEIESVRARQESYLRRELDRVDRYFAGYAEELTQRASRSHSDNTKLRVQERLAAAKAEHLRRREDQVQRHEIRILPRIDALVLMAEPAWRAAVTVTRHGAHHTTNALFVPRLRRWYADTAAM
jgi:hypothetical protein